MKRFLGVCALALTAACGSGGEVSQPKGSDYTPGVQLYTLRAPLAEDYEGTLQNIADVGYDQVELAGFFGRDPSEVREILASKGLTPVASHVDWRRFRDTPEVVIDEAKAVGAEYAILAYLPEDQRQTLAQWQDWVERIDQAGAYAEKIGIKFAYHNHEFEFEEVEGVIPFDLILEGTDPDRVKIELDVFWATLAGFDPVAIMEANPGRIPLLHIKDMESTDQSMVDVGRGDIDFARILSTGRETGVEHYFVEHDNPGDPLVSISYAYEHLSDLEF